MAPNLQFANIDVDDTQGDGNGFIDQNETVTLQINGMNIGHATAPDAYLSASCNDNRIHLIDNQIQIGAVEPNGTFTAELPLSSDSDILGGTVFHLTLELHSGSYTTLHDYVFAVGVAVETFESGDFSFLEWEHGGDSHWFVTDQESHNGTYSARTGEIGNDEVTPSNRLTISVSLILGNAMVTSRLASKTACLTASWASPPYPGKASA